MMEGCSTPEFFFRPIYFISTEGARFADGFGKPTTSTWIAMEYVEGGGTTCTNSCRGWVRMPWPFVSRPGATDVARPAGR